MRKKILLISGIAALILLISAVLTGSCFLFEKKADLPSVPQDFGAMLMGMQKLNLHLRTAADAPAGMTKRLILTESEFNMLTNSFVTNPFFISQSGGAMPDFLRQSRIISEKDVLRIHYAHDSGESNPFGRYLNFRFRLKASAKKGEFAFEVLSCRIGQFRIPIWLAKKILSSSMRKNYDNSPTDRILRGGNVSLTSSPGVLILEYQPNELIDAADLVYFGSVNNRIRRTAESYGRRNGRYPGFR